MNNYFVTSSTTQKHRPLTTGFEDVADAQAQAEFLANTYGGVAKIIQKGIVVSKYSTKQGWMEI